MAVTTLKSLKSHQRKLTPILATLTKHETSTSGSAIDNPSARLRNQNYAKLQTKNPKIGAVDSSDYNLEATDEAHRFMRNTAGHLKAESATQRRESAETY